MTKVHGGTSMKEIISGIYAIVNTVNGHRYIGSAVDVQRRWDKHKAELRRGNHHSRHLQNAWNKYGECSFSFLLLRKVEDQSKLLLNEQEFINSRRPEYVFPNVCWWICLAIC